MYLWKVDSLVDDFRSGNVSQKEEFKYMLLLTVFMCLACDPILYIDYSYNMYDAIVTCSTIIITIFGLYYCFKINSSGDNKDYLVRVVCIGLPVIIRVIVFFIPIIFIGVFIELFFINPELLDDENTETTLMESVFISLFVVAYYWYLSIKIKAVSKIN